MSDNQQIEQTFDHEGNTNQSEITTNQKTQNNQQTIVENVQERDEQQHEQNVQQNGKEKEENKQENIQQEVTEGLENGQENKQEEGLKQSLEEDSKQNEEIEVQPKISVEVSDPIIPITSQVQYSQAFPQIQPQTNQQQSKQQQLPEIKQQKNQLQQKPVENNQPTNVNPPQPSQTLQERIDQSNTMKTKGNDCYKNGDYNLAIHHYYQGLRVLDPNQLNKGTADIIQQSKNLAFSLILNIAQSHVKLGNFPQAVVCCTEVLNSVPRHYKALYKRATCYFQIKKLEQAFKDIKLAYEVDPKNNQGIQMYRKIRKAYEAQNKQIKQSQKQLYKNMFNPQQKSQKSTQQTTSSKKQSKISILKMIILGSLAATGTYFLANNSQRSLENSQKASIVGSVVSGSLIAIPKVSTRAIGAVGLVAIAVYLLKKK